MVTSIELGLSKIGRWRWARVTPNGFARAVHGVSRAIVPNERLVHTEVFEALPQGGALKPVQFDDRGGRTTVRIIVEHAPKAHHDRPLNAGPEVGPQDALDLLASAVLAAIET